MNQSYKLNLGLVIGASGYRSSTAKEACDSDLDGICDSVDSCPNDSSNNCASPDMLAEHVRMNDKLSGQYFHQTESCQLIIPKNY